MKDEADQALLKEEEETEHQKMACVHSNFNNPDDFTYAPSISYSISRTPPTCSIQPSKIDVTFANGSSSKHTIGNKYKDSYLD